MAHKKRVFIGEWYPEGCGDLRPVFVAGQPTYRDNEVVDVTIRFFRVADRRLTSMFARFSNVHTLRLEDTPYETDTNFIPPQYQLKTLILVHTIVPPVMAFAMPRLNTLVFRADRPTLRFADTFTMYRRRDFEHFVMYSDCLRMVRFDRIMLKGMVRKIMNSNVAQVNMGPAIDIHNYFPKADFDPYQD